MIGIIHHKNNLLYFFTALFQNQDGPADECVTDETVLSTNYHQSLDMAIIMFDILLSYL